MNNIFKSQVGLAAFIAVCLGLTACSGEIIPRDATNPEKAHAVSLKMEKKRIKRFNCTGDLTSDRVEVVKAPTELMEIHPNYSGWTSSNISSSDFQNRKTGASAPSVVDYVKFTVDHGNGYFNMKVADGVNEIRYRFAFKTGEVEEGSRYINVTYSEELLPGVDEVRPTLQECAPH
jgi:hypothetical protein